MAAEHIFGCNVGSIKDKTVRQPPHQVNTYAELVPRGILNSYCKVTLAFDVMFMNGLSFLVTISWNIYFRKVKTLNDIECPSLVNRIRHVWDIYKHGRFKVDWIPMDEQVQSRLDTNGWAVQNITG